MSTFQKPFLYQILGLEVPEVPVTLTRTVKSVQRGTVGGQSGYIVAISGVDTTKSTLMLFGNKAANGDNSGAGIAVGAISSSTTLNLTYSLQIGSNNGPTYGTIYWEVVEYV